MMGSCSMEYITMEQYIWSIDSRVWSTDEKFELECLDNVDNIECYYIYNTNGTG